MAAAVTNAEVYLAKCLKVTLPEGRGRAAPTVVSTAAKNLQALGFGLSSPLLERLIALGDERVIEWYETVLPILQKMVGAHLCFDPMYPNFPQQVMEASDAELFFNAMTHYYGFFLSDLLGDPNLVVLPHYEKEVRPILDEFHELRWIDLGSDEDFDAIFTRLASSNGSLSDADKIFEPKTVQDKIDITASTRACVPVIIDAQDRRVYWTDLGLKSTTQINNAARNSVGFSQIGRSIVGLQKPTLHDLFSMHAEGRGRLVDSVDHAETVFGLHEGTVTAFDTNIVMSEYLI